MQPDPSPPLTPPSPKHAICSCSAFFCTCTPYVNVAGRRPSLASLTVIHCRSYSLRTPLTCAHFKHCILCCWTDWPRSDLINWSPYSTISPRTPPCSGEAPYVLRSGYPGFHQHSYIRQTSPMTFWLWMVEGLAMTMWTAKQQVMKLLFPSVWPFTCHG